MGVEGLGVEDLGFGGLGVKLGVQGLGPAQCKGPKTWPQPNKRSSSHVPSLVAWASRCTASILRGPPRHFMPQIHTKLFLGGSLKRILISANMCDTQSPQRLQTLDMFWGNHVKYYIYIHTCKHISITVS